MFIRSSFAKSELYSYNTRAFFTLLLSPDSGIAMLRGEQLVCACLAVDSIAQYHYVPSTIMWPQAVRTLGQLSRFSAL